MNAAKPERQSVAICIATRERPESLQTLLTSIAALEIDDATTELLVVVADNDERGSARDVCDDATRWLGYPLRYVHEPRPGIPMARNASLSPVAGKVDWIVFVDDDEIVPGHWIAALCATQTSTQADVVTGPVRAVYAHPPPRWWSDAGFHDTPEHPEGSVRSVAYTHNTLVRAARLGPIGPWFDERLPSGEDVALFRSLVKGGATIVWSREAFVQESVTPNRVSWRGMLRRGWREGVALARVARWYEGASRLEAFYGGLLRAGWNAARAIAPYPAPLGERARALRRVSTGLGRCFGAIF
ncbi:MAG: glycosyltransferase [Myxococcota bacterium]